MRETSTGIFCSFCMGNCFGRALAPVSLHPRQYGVDNPDFPYYKYCLGFSYTCDYNNITSVNIFVIYSHYDPGKPFLMGGYFFSATPCT